MEFGKRHDTTDTTDFCKRQLATSYGLVVYVADLLREVANLLRTCYGETDVMDFGLKPAGTIEIFFSGKASS